MRYLCLLMIYMTLFTIIANSVNQEMKQNLEPLQERLEKEELKRELDFLSYHTKIGKKISRVWDKVWGGERERQR